MWSERCQIYARLARFRSDDSCEFSKSNAMAAGGASITELPSSCAGLRRVDHEGGVGRGGNSVAILTVCHGMRVGVRAGCHAACTLRAPRYVPLRAGPARRSPDGESLRSTRAPERRTPAPSGCGRPCEVPRGLIHW